MVWMMTGHPEREKSVLESFLLATKQVAKSHTHHSLPQLIGFPRSYHPDQSLEVQPSQVPGSYMAKGIQKVSLKYATPA